MKTFWNYSSVLTLTTFVLFSSNLDSFAERKRAFPPAPKEQFTVPTEEMVWGKTTDVEFLNPFQLERGTFKIGLRVKKQLLELSGNPPNIASPVSVYMESLAGRPIWEIEARTNGPGLENNEFVRHIFLPPEKERFSIQMTNLLGVRVPKTSAGCNLSYPNLTGKEWRHWDRNNIENNSLLSHEDVELYSFNPTNYFSISVPGLYKLTLTQYLYIIGTNNLLKPITLPPVTIDVKVEK